MEKLIQSKKQPWSEPQVTEINVKNTEDHIVYKVNGGSDCMYDTEHTDHVS
ncbi:hypothetical protein Dtox_3273 [Desulfofarcimen acetoxidans DSM 771]|uniref:Uncharacterized protein n=1 Tax=Desulfofarcimen acetoxidans (strain ATCC 49208 / DSM 771 / KCTC 5769 / VKM B-1644 / 5575) TaxID=485916 RepID=C8W5K7_DESAS|nr:hypothetical protein [Desulfofarcimen acetoxidans]ACV64007.1 hypothetical protein Dtox_3273 [Desulfofarcimen acetoxidans DSM 771]